MPAPDDCLNLKMSTSGQAFYILFGIINLSLAFFYSDGQNPCYIDKFGGEKRYLRLAIFQFLACKARPIIGIMKLSFILPLKNVKHEK
jgi:hypothetical protein